jgi:hypothetical protein
MIPGEAQVEIKGPLRVGVPSFDALKVCPSSVFAYLEIKFHR